MEQFYTENSLILFLLYIWSLFWKGLALWRSSKLDQRNWFIAMLVLNTAGLLEIIYLFWFAKKRFSIKELKSWNWQVWKKSTEPKS